MKSKLIHIGNNSNVRVDGSDNITIINRCNGEAVQITCDKEGICVQQVKLKLNLNKN